MVELVRNCLLLYLIIYLVFIAFIDWKKQVFSEKIIFAHYPIVLVIGRLSGQSWSELLIAFLSFALTLYLVQVIKNDGSMGALDFFIMPLFTTLYGSDFLVYVIVMTFMSCIAQVKPFKTFLKVHCKDSNHIPLVPTMVLALLFTVNRIKF